MPLKKKHTGLYFASSFNYRIDVKALFVCLFFLFTLSTGFASDQVVDNVYVTENTTIVYAQNDTNNVIITEGKITAVEGKSIRLLPGTHIKSGEQLTVNIASKESQKAVEKKVNKQKEDKMLASAVAKREEALIPANAKEDVIGFRYCDLPDENATIAQQQFQLLATVASTTVTFTTPVVTLDKKRSSFNFFNTQVSAYQLSYTPIYSWGNCAQTIKVMRC
jgi:phosphotransferase system HPr-like phosphotransfer protein